MKIIVRNATHVKYKSYDCSIIKIKNKIFKFIYNSYNAEETFVVLLFDGNQWNNILNMWDLGVVPDGNSYNICTEKEREARANSLISKAHKMCLDILTNNE